MLVKDVLTLAANLLERQDLAKELGEKTEQFSADAEALLRCYNIVEHEVALDYFPLKHEERLAAEEGRVLYTAFSLFPVRILGVKDSTGRQVRCTVFPTCIRLHEPVSEVEVVYVYLPKNKEMTGETEFGDSVSARLLAYGTASEQCLSIHCYTEGRMWGEKYRDALKAEGILRRPLSVRSRRWI